MASAATLELVVRIKIAAPAARFALLDLRIRHARTMGTGHLQLRLDDAGRRIWTQYYFDALYKGLAGTLTAA